MGHPPISHHTSPPSCPSICPVCGLAEKWRPVRRFEDAYEISNIGRVRSVARVVGAACGSTRVISGRVLRARRIVLSRPGASELILRWLLFVEHFSRAAPGGAPVWLDGNLTHLCVGNLSWEFPQLAYRPMHRKVDRLRGSAKDHACVDCSGVAEEWSYTDSGYCQAADERADGSLVTYSLDPAEYEPRCRSCHRKFDGAGVDRIRRTNGQWTPRAVA